MRQGVGAPDRRPEASASPAPHRLLSGVDIAPGLHDRPVRRDPAWCIGVEIHDEVFVGQGVMFVNDDHHRRATGALGALHREGDRELVLTVVGRGASVGSGAVIATDVRADATGMPARALADHAYRTART